MSHRKEFNIGQMVFASRVSAGCCLLITRGDLADGHGRFGASRRFFPGQYQEAVIALDVIIGLLSFAIAAGLLVYKGWARKAWLIFLLALLFAHSVMISAEVMLGHKIRGWLYQWIAMIILMTLVSWIYLTKASVRSRFR
jgi:hypothetical protein